MKVLVTCFEPFGGAAVNASLEAVRLLPPRADPLEINTARLPTSFSRSHHALEEALARIDPEVVLCVGQAGERSALCVERVAVNIQHAQIPDNDGMQPLDTPVVPHGPGAYLATLPVRDAVTALQEAGMPVQLSMSAGTFVCNHVFYHLLHGQALGARRYRGGFLHVPALAARAGNGPTLSVEDIARAILIVLRSATPHAGSTASIKSQRQ